MVRQQLSEQLSETLSRLQKNIDDQITAEVESATEFQRDENMALTESLASLQQETAQLRCTVEDAKRVKVPQWKIRVGFCCIFGHRSETTGGASQCFGVG